MLTVARAAADAAARPRRGRRAPAARRVSARLPRLPARRWPAPRSSSQVLRDAGVVDAGGRGLCVILDAAETVLTGRRRGAGQRPARRRHRSRCRSPDRTT